MADVEVGLIPNPIPDAVLVAEKPNPALVAGAEVVVVPKLRPVVACVVVAVLKLSPVVVAVVPKLSPDTALG